MLTSIHSNPQAYAQIEGNPNCLCLDVGYKAIHQMQGYGEWLDDSRRRYPREVPLIPEQGYYMLFEGQIYKFILNKITIPKDHYGLLFPRSTFLRMGLIMTPSAFWDPGYSGNGVATAVCMAPFVKIGLDVKPFSLALFKAEDLVEYSGKYQGEEYNP